MTTTTLLALFSALAGSGIFAALATKYLRPNATPIEILKEVRAERDNERARIDELESDMRVLTDYVHQLREHISAGKAPPPPAWPESLRP